MQSNPISPASNQLPLPITFTNPSIWIHHKQVAKPVTIENPIESIWSYICRIFIAIITCSIFNGIPNREYDRRIIHTIEERLTCTNKNAMSEKDFALALAYQRATIDPLREINVREPLNNIRDANSFSIVSRRTIMNWYDTTRLETTIHPENGQPVTMPPVEKPVTSHLSDRANFGSPSVADVFPTMRPNTTFALNHDVLDGTDRVQQAPWFVGYVRMCALFKWLGINDERGRNISSDAQRLASYFGGLTEITNRSSSTIAQTLTGFSHTGYWIVSLQEQNGTKTITFSLKSVDKSIPANIEQQLDEKYRLFAADWPREIRELVNVKSFVDRATGQIGYSVARWA